MGCNGLRTGMGGFVYLLILLRNMSIVFIILGSNERQYSMESLTTITVRIRKFVTFKK